MQGAGCRLQSEGRRVKGNIERHGMDCGVRKPARASFGWDMYRGTSPITPPPLGPYSRPMPRDLW